MNDLMLLVKLHYQNNDNIATVLNRFRALKKRTNNNKRPTEDCFEI